MQWAMQPIKNMDVCEWCTVEVLCVSFFLPFIKWPQKLTIHLSSSFLPFVRERGWTIGAKFALFLLAFALPVTMMTWWWMMFGLWPPFSFDFSLCIEDEKQLHKVFFSFCWTLLITFIFATFLHVIVIFIRFLPIFFCYCRQKRD